jgi:TonB family protein
MKKLVIVLGLLLLATLLAMTVFFVLTLHHPSLTEHLDSTGKTPPVPAPTPPAALGPPAAVEGHTGHDEIKAQPGEAEAISVAADEMAARLISKLPGRMPDDVNIHGTVVLAALIDERGRVQSLKVISGHAMLRGAAIDAVKDWTYQPYIKDDKPVSVKTTISVVF